MENSKKTKKPKRKYVTNKPFCWDDEKLFITRLGKANTSVKNEMPDVHRAMHKNGELYTRLELLKKYLWCVENVRHFFCKNAPKRKIVKLLTHCIEKEEGV